MGVWLLEQISQIERLRLSKQIIQGIRKHRLRGVVFVLPSREQQICMGDKEVSEVREPSSGLSQLFCEGEGGQMLVKGSKKCGQVSRGKFG
jgi:hypothetical protein